MITMPIARITKALIKPHSVGSHPYVICDNPFSINGAATGSTTSAVRFATNAFILRSPFKKMAPSPEVGEGSWFVGMFVPFLRYPAGFRTLIAPDGAHSLLKLKKAKPGLPDPVAAVQGMVRKRRAIGDTENPIGQTSLFVPVPVEPSVLNSPSRLGHPSYGILRIAFTLRTIRSRIALDFIQFPGPPGS